MELFSYSKRSNYDKEVTKHSEILITNDVHLYTNEQKSETRERFLSFVVSKRGRRERWGPGPPQDKLLYYHATDGGISTVKQ
jgi:hypothetical protein